MGLRDAVEERLGSPWLLVNVAGVFFEHDVPDLAVEDYDRIVDVNLKGTFLTCKTFLPAMLAEGSGCIVNIASTAGIKGGHRRAVYNASKGGVVLLTRSLALDHGPSGVRINCVCPGLIDTPMADWIRLDPQALTAFEQEAPARRMGTPEDVAGAVSFLASDDADVCPRHRAGGGRRRDRMKKRGLTPFFRTCTGARPPPARGRGPRRPRPRCA